MSFSAKGVGGMNASVSWLDTPLPCDAKDGSWLASTAASNGASSLFSALIRPGLLRPRPPNVLIFLLSPLPLELERRGSSTLVDSVLEARKAVQGTVHSVLYLESLCCM